MIDTNAVRALAKRARVAIEHLIIHTYFAAQVHTLDEADIVLRQCADEIDKGRALERERCAKLLESLAPAGTDSVLLAAAKEIRALYSYPLCDCNAPTDNCGRAR